MNIWMLSGKKIHMIATEYMYTHVRERIDKSHLHNAYSADCLKVTSLNADKHYSVTEPVPLRVNIF